MKRPPQLPQQPVFRFFGPKGNLAGGRTFGALRKATHALTRRDGRPFRLRSAAAEENAENRARLVDAGIHGFLSVVLANTEDKYTNAHIPARSMTGILTHQHAGTRYRRFSKEPARSRSRADNNRRAQAVVSSASRYTLAEVTPASRLVVTTTTSRQAEVRFDCRHRVWHLAHPATAEVDNDANQSCASENGISSPPSDSHGGAVFSDRRHASEDGGTDRDQARRDGPGVSDSVACGSPKERSNDEVMTKTE